MPEEIRKKIERRFDPKNELEKIKSEVRNAPKEDQSPLRRDLVEKFKEEFISQKEGIAEIKDKIELAILNNPDASADEIFAKVGDLAERHRLSVRQEIYVWRAIHKYVAKHGIIRDYIESYRQKFPEEKEGDRRWKEEFFRGIFGFEPKGEIDLDVGPMTLYWKCHDPGDFARAYGEEKEAHGYVGFKAAVSGLPGLEETVNVENSSLIKTARHSSGYSASTKRHEEMHTIRDLLMPENERPAKNFPEKLSAPEDAARAVRVAVRNETRKIYGRAEDEILSHLKEGGMRIREIAETVLVGYRLFGGAYNKIAGKALKSLLEKYPGQGDFSLLIENEMKEANREYFLSVARAADAAEDISVIPKYFLPLDLITVLSGERLEKWPRLADQLWEKYLKGMNKKELEELMTEMSGREKWTIVSKIEKFLSKRRMEGGK